MLPHGMRAAATALLYLVGRTGADAEVRADAIIPDAQLLQLAEATPALRKGTSSLGGSALCVGSTGSDWTQHLTSGITMNVSTASCGFTQVPVYVTSLYSPAGGHQGVTGDSEPYDPTPAGFTAYISTGVTITAASAQAAGWHVDWTAHEAGKLAGPQATSCAGATTPGSTAWVAYTYSGSHTGIYVDVDISHCGFAAAPIVVTSLGGDQRHWTTSGSAEVYDRTDESFRIYVFKPGEDSVTPALANEWLWHVNWIAQPAGLSETPGMKTCAGLSGESWTNEFGGISMVTDISSCGFSSTPTFAVALDGPGGHHWRARGTSAVYAASATSFSTRLGFSGMTPSLAESRDYRLMYFATGPVAPPDGSAAALGDPHMSTVKGERFDLAKPGRHVLIQIPLGAEEGSSLLRVEVDAERTGSSCADMYIMSANLTGRWVSQRYGEPGLRFRAGGLGPDHGWQHFGPVDLRVAHGRTSAGVAYLNLFARHLAEAGHRIGGLLGEDDHTEAARSQCRSVLSLHEEESLAGLAAGSRSRLGSVAEARF